MNLSILAEISDKVPSTLSLLLFQLPVAFFAFCLCFGWRSFAKLWFALALAWLGLSIHFIWFDGELAEAMYRECGVMRLVSDAAVCTLPMIAVGIGLLIPFSQRIIRTPPGFDVIAPTRTGGAGRIST